MPVTTLSAVNDVLRRIGKPVVAALDTAGGSLSSYAERAIDDASKTVQQEGWTWNTKADVEIAVDSNGKYNVSDLEADGSEILSVDADRAQGETINVVRKGNFLYDLDNNTFTPADGTMKVTYVYQRPVAELPDSFAKWVVALAALSLSRQFYSDRNREEIISVELADARRLAVNEEIRIVDVNVLDTTAMRQIRGRPRMRDRSI